MARTKNADQQAQQTRKRLREALLALMEQRGFAKVNVQQICMQAGVSRGTFYLHYQHKHALLDELIDHMIEESGSDERQADLTECQRICANAAYAPLYQDDEAAARLISRLVERNAARAIPSLMADCKLDEVQASALFAYMLYGNVAVNRLMGWRMDGEWDRASRTARTFAEGGLAALRAQG